MHLDVGAYPRKTDVYAGMSEWKVISVLTGYVLADGCPGDKVGCGCENKAPSRAVVWAKRRSC